MIQNNSCPYCGASKVTVLEHHDPIIGVTTQQACEAYDATLRISQLPGSRVVETYCGGCGLVFHPRSVML